MPKIDTSTDSVGEIWLSDLLVNLLTSATSTSLDSSISVAISAAEISVGISLIRNFLVMLSFGVLTTMGIPKILVSWLN